ncbi:MAG TPA: hypothetical protein PLG77_03160 [Burkholderiaceae bacterium]|nr:hypothetical protein [Burkholderiaceae bacterium]
MNAASLAGSVRFDAGGIACVDLAETQASITTRATARLTNQHSN